MARFFVRLDAIRGGRVRFDTAETRHLARVLRLRPGALLEATDGAGRVLTIRLESVGPHGAEGRLVAESVPGRESPCAVTLAQSELKGDRMAWLVQKATELGVARIAPMVTARVVARAAPGRPGARQVRWERVAREAVKQCRRGVAPVIDPSRPLADVLTEVARHDVTWLCRDGAGEPLRTAARVAGHPRRVLLLVGPEGGFTEAETDEAAAHGARLVGLGPRVLRAESAGLVALALCQFLFGDVGGEDVDT
jgi:16S rRNA (uracil1498-N3)-methyltransferase